MILTNSTQRNPIIGWQNVVTTSNITADSTAAGFPASNLANPAVNQIWRSAVITQQRLNINSGAAPISYIGIAGHNFFSAKAGIRIEAYQAPDPATRMMLHFNGDNATTQFTDEVGNVWTANGNAQLGSARFRFGVSAGLFDGAGDWISTPDSGLFTLGSGPWTLEFYFFINDAGGASRFLCGQAAASALAATISLSVERNNTNQIVAAAFVGGTAFSIVSTNTFTTSSNIGWHHLAFVRNASNQIKLFIDGVQEGSTVAIAGTVNDSPNQWAIGRLGEFNANMFLGSIDEFRLTVGTALYDAPFTRPSSPFQMTQVDAYGTRSEAEEVILRMDANDGVGVFRDDGRFERIWTAVNGAVIQTNVDGFPAAYFNGVNQYITAPGFLNMGSADFTFDGYFKIDPTDTGGVYLELAGQCDTAATPSSVSFLIERNAANFFRGIVYVGSTEFATSSSVPYTGSMNPGWHHFAFSRFGNSLLLFIDGTLVSTTAIAGTVNNSPNLVSVGRAGEFNSGYWKGWADNLRFIRNTARWTADFTPPGRTSRIPDSDGPILMHFDKATYTRIQVQLLASVTAPQAGVVYAGDALVLQRSIDINVGHAVINQGRQSNVAVGKSESGKHLGRIVLGQWNEGGADFKWFEPDWYRTYFDPFLANAIEFPFFFAWNPIEYPNDVGYVSLSDDPVPTTDPVTRRVAVNMKFSGEAAP